MSHDVKQTNPSRKRARRIAGAALGALVLGAGSTVGVGFFPPATPAYAQNLSESVNRPNVPGFADIVQKVSPAVVSIRVKEHANPELSNFPSNSPFERFFKDFQNQFGHQGQGDNNDNQQHSQRNDQNGQGGSDVIMGQGSGFFITSDGYIVTNNHVVDHADSVKVVLQDGTILNAKVVGTDEKTDLALVKVTDPKQSFPFVKFDNKPVRVGDWVIAVGNPFGLGGTVTAGIVSARGRDIGAGPYDDFLQIDAPINRGNSGGPTFDLNGEVVGINTAIYSPSGGSVGIGFAIPASVAAPVIHDLMTNGKVTRGWLGVEIQTVTPDIADSLGLKSTGGALVASPQPNSPAAQAGIKAGDVIESVDGENVKNARELARIISTKQPGSKVTLTILRNGQQQQVAVDLGKLPSNTQQAKAEQNQSTNKELGMTLAPTSQLGIDTQGLAVVELDHSSVAAEKGVKVGDVIVSANGQDVTSAQDLSAAVKQAQQEGRNNVLLKVQSGNNTRFVALPVKQG